MYSYSRHAIPALLNMKIEKVDLMNRRWCVHLENPGDPIHVDDDRAFCGLRNPTEDSDMDSNDINVFD